MPVRSLIRAASVRLFSPLTARHVALEARVVGERLERAQLLVEVARSSRRRCAW